MSDQTVTTWRVRSAINRVARQILSELDLEDWIEWEDLPLICEDDFERVRERAQEILRALATSSDAQIAEAHQILEARVNNDAE